MDFALPADDDPRRSTLRRWLDAHPDVHLAVMNNEYCQPFIRLPPERYHFQTFGSLADYLQFLERVDIGLAPMLPSGYNLCRSDVKFLEYASACPPTPCSARTSGLDRSPHSMHRVRIPPASM